MSQKENDIIATHVKDREVYWGDKVVEIRKEKCTKNKHNIVILRYEDSSIWIYCPNFTWTDSAIICNLPTKVGKKTRCRFFHAV